MLIKKIKFLSCSNCANGDRSGYRDFQKEGIIKESHIDYGGSVIKHEQSISYEKKHHITCTKLMLPPPPPAPLVVLMPRYQTN